MTTWLLVTVRGRLDLTKSTVQHLLHKQPEELKIIVVDNGSRDEALDWLYRVFRSGRIHRLVCNKVGTIPQWEKSYAIRQAHYLLRDEEYDRFGWVDNDIDVQVGWLAAAKAVLGACPDVDVVSMHNDGHQEKHHNTVAERKIGKVNVRFKETANGAFWIMRRNFFDKHGLPPIRLGGGREGAEDWYYSDLLKQRGRLFAVVDGFSKHMGYATSLKKRALAGEKP